MMDRQRLVGGWLSLMDALEHADRFIEGAQKNSAKATDMLEAIHYLRVAQVNLEAGGKDNRTISGFAAALARNADELENSAYSTMGGGSLLTTRDISGRMERLLVELRKEIDRIHSH